MVGRRGYTKDGYPIVWLKNNTKKECLEHLKNGTKPLPKTKIKEKIINNEDDEVINFFKYKIGEIPVEITVDKRQYTLKVDGHLMYLNTYNFLLISLRESLIKAELKGKYTEETSAQLKDIIEAENKINSALIKFKPGDDFHKAFE